MIELVKNCSENENKVENSKTKTDYLINRVRNEFEACLLGFLRVVWNVDYNPTISDVTRELNMNSINSDSFMLNVLLNLQSANKLNLRMNSAEVIKIYNNESKNTNYISL